MMNNSMKEALAVVFVIIALGLAVSLLLVVIFTGIRATRVETWCSPDQIQWQVVDDFDQRGCESLERTITITLDR